MKNLAKRIAVLSAITISLPSACLDAAKVNAWTTRAIPVLKQAPRAVSAPVAGRVAQAAMGAANTALNPLAGVGDDLTKSAASALGGGEGNNVLEKFANDVKEKIGLGNDKKLEARLVALEQRVTTLEGRGRR